ncbi:Protein ATP1B4 [Fasciola hepatica]|uniref:Protein ATP1B4 n=1 Tax=Fasciola hepatica TaxID=6192 RepID=A0A4E0RY91_FASHE|nr:Protein ATP1B4 [Fasciola hepatica]
MQERHHTVQKDCFYIVLFYFTFYILLIILNACLLTLFLWRMISLDHPTVTGDFSALRNQPGLSLVPVIDTKHTLIHYRNGYRDSYHVYVDSLHAFMQIYEDPWDRQDYIHNCFSRNLTTTISVPLGHRTSCMFDSSWAYRCNINRDFGYDDGSPCIMLRLNKVYGWIPSIGETEAGAEVCCRGATPNDDGFLGTMCYYDALHHDENACQQKCGLFPHQFYPYLNQISYQPPVVFLELRQPKKNVLFRVRCHLNNLDYNSSVEFEMLID